MLLKDDIDDEVYQRFIEYALAKSDAVMLVTIQDEPATFFYEDHIKKAKQILPSFVPDRQTIQRLKREELTSRHDAEIFRKSCKPFLKMIEPWRMKQRHNPIWPSTEIISAPYDYDINLYLSEKEIEGYLMKPGGYLKWRYPYYPEDLSFFKDNYCWAYANSHEEYVEIIPENEEEYQKFLDMGIEFDNEYDAGKKEELFFEEY